MSQAGHEPGRPLGSRAWGPRAVAFLGVVGAPAPPTAPTAPNIIICSTNSGTIRRTICSTIDWEPRGRWELLGEVGRVDLAVSKHAFTLREDLHPVRRDQHGVLELGRKGAVLGHRGPIVVQHFDFVAADVDHRLDREGHARLEAIAFAPVPVVLHLRLIVELAADAVADEIAHDRAALTLGELLNSRPNVAEAR